MAPNQKGKKHLSSENDGSSEAIPWPDLPSQLNMFVGKQMPQLLNNISWGGVCKSWRTVPRRCSSATKAPWLELSEANDNNNIMKLNSKRCHNKPRPHFKAIKDYLGFFDWLGRSRRWASPEPWMRYIGSSHGYLVSTSLDNICLSTLAPSHWRSSMVMSPWDTEIPFVCAALLPSPDPSSMYNTSVMVITGISNPAFFIFRNEKCRRIRASHDCTVIDPHPSEGISKPMVFTNAIGFKGRFYALSSQGSLAIIEEVKDSQFRITGLGKNRAVSSVPCRHFLEYLMDSNGEILLVFLVSKTSMNDVDDVEVFRLDLPRLVWVKMESLGERALFIGTNCCMSVSARQVGCKRNLVYFTHHALDCWKEYDMANGRISPCCDNYGSQVKSPKWDQS